MSLDALMDAPIEHIQAIVVHEQRTFFLMCFLSHLKALLLRGKRLFLDFFDAEVLANKLTFQS